MIRCVKCILPESFPGITFDSEGICSVCTIFNEQKQHIPSLEKLKTKFDQLVSENKSDDSKYNALVAFSGGKDLSLIHI